MHLRLASLSPLACLLAPPLTSQAADKALFHRSQWGVDFQIGSGFAGAGAIHIDAKAWTSLYMYQQLGRLE